MNLKATNEELFNFDDVSQEIEDELDQEEDMKRFAAEFPGAMDYLMGTPEKPGKYFKLMNKFLDKFDYVSFEPMVLSLAVIGMLEAGWEPSDIFAEVDGTIESHFAQTNE